MPPSKSKLLPTLPHPPPAAAAAATGGLLSRTQGFSTAAMEPWTRPGKHLSAL